MFNDANLFIFSNMLFSIGSISKFISSFELIISVNLDNTFMPSVVIKFKSIFNEKFNF